MIFEWQKLKAIKGNFMLSLLIVLFCLWSIVSFLRIADNQQEELTKTLAAEIAMQQQLVSQGDASDQASIQAKEELHWLEKRLEGIHSNNPDLADNSLYELEKMRLANATREDSRRYYQLKVAELDYFQTAAIPRIDQEYPEKRPLVQYLTHLLMTLSTGAVLLLIGAFFSFWLTEEYRNQTAVWLSTFPVKRTKQLLSKYSVTSFFVAGSAGIGLAIGGVIAVIKYGIGHWVYPIFYFNYQAEIISMTSQTYLIKQALSWMVLCFFIGSLALLISVAFRQTTASLLGVSMLAILLLMPGLLRMLPERWIPYLPTSYLDLPELILENNIWNNAQLSWEKGMLYLSLLGLLFLFCSFINYEKLPMTNWNIQFFKKQAIVSQKRKRPLKGFAIEWKKMGGKKLFFSCFFLLFLFPIYLFQMEVEYSTNSRIEHFSEEYEQQVALLTELEQMGFPEETRLQVGKQTEWLAARVDALAQQDDLGIVKSQYEIEKINLELAQKGLIAAGALPEQQLIVDELAFFKDSNIKMVASQRSFPTTQPMIYFWTKLFNVISLDSLVMLMSLFFVFFFTLEYRKGSNEWLSTFPISPWIQLRDKIITAFLFVTGSLLASTLISGGVTALFYGVGSFRYPLFYLDAKQQVQSMLSSEFLIRQGLSILVVIGFVLSIVLFFSVIFKNTFLTLIASFSALIFGMIEGVFERLTATWATYIPLRYLKLTDFILGNQLELTWLKGVLSMSLSSVLLLSLTMYLKQHVVKNTHRWAKESGKIENHD